MARPRQLRDALAVLALLWLVGLVGTDTALGRILLLVGAIALGLGGVLGLGMSWSQRPARRAHRGPARDGANGPP